jgi:hypothetical protein
MKALWFLPFTFAAGAEGFALFAPYLIGLLTVLHFVRSHRTAVQAVAVARSTPIEVPSDLRPALA